MFAYRRFLRKLRKFIPFSIAAASLTMAKPAQAFDLPMFGHSVTYDQAMQTQLLARVGIAEERVSATIMTMKQTAANNYSEYVADRAELTALLEKCDRDPNSCPPAIQEFSKMRKLLQQVPDGLARAVIINTWVNAHVTYDQGELGRSMGDILAHKKIAQHRTIVQALLEGNEVCDKIAQTKFSMDSGDTTKGSLAVIVGVVGGSTSFGGHAMSLYTAKNGEQWLLNCEADDTPVTPKNMDAQINKISEIYAIGRIVPDIKGTFLPFVVMHQFDANGVHGFSTTIKTNKRNSLKLQDLSDAQFGGREVRQAVMERLRWAITHSGSSHKPVMTVIDYSAYSKAQAPRP